MANVSKLDMKHKLEFLREFLPKHLGMTVEDVNGEVRKRFGIGIDKAIISKERDKAKHANPMKRGARKLGSTPSVIESVKAFNDAAEVLSKTMRDAKVVSCSFTADPTGAIHVAYEYETVVVDRKRVTITL